MMHIVNGDATAEPLRRSGVPGTVAVWADVLHEGPVPSDIDDPGWRETRARFLSKHGFISYADALSTFATWYAALDSFVEHDEVVIWLEHDLFDQLLLLHHLEWIARRDRARTRFSLICIDRFPGIEPFHGLGQLNPRQLASLLGSQQEISAAQIALGRRAWSAFTGNDPMEVQRLIDADTSALPFLEGALRRLLEEYPALETGLPRTERHALESLRDGPHSKTGLFRAVRGREDRVFMGDTTFWNRLEAMERGRWPLIAIDDDVSITDAGQRVLDGALDWVEMGGIDRWIGGVHLRGTRVPWRWDRKAVRLVAV